MIILCKKFWGFEVAVTSCIAVIFYVLLKMSPNQAYWIANVFHDKMFLFILLPIYLLVNFIIEKSVSIVQITKMKTRERAILFVGIQQVLNLFLLVTTWFLIITVFTILQFGKITEISLSELLISYITYCEEMLLVSSVVIILRKSNKRNLQEFSYVITYGMVVLENTLVPELNMLLPIDVYLCFSWIFSRYSFAPIVLLFLNAMFVMIIIRKSSYEDIFR